MQTGSILIPALLSIQHMFEGSTTSNPMYWTTWGLALMVGLFTNYISLFSIDEKYYTLEKSYNNLVTVGWQYFQLAGKYGKRKDNMEPTHINMFEKFCDDIEDIIMKESKSISKAITNTITNKNNNKLSPNTKHSKEPEK